MANNATVTRNGYRYEALYGDSKELRAAALGRCDGLLKDEKPSGELLALVSVTSETESDKKPLYMVRLLTADGVRMYATQSDNVVSQVNDIVSMMEVDEVAIIRVSMQTSEKGQSFIAISVDDFKTKEQISTNQ